MSAKRDDLQSGDSGRSGFKSQQTHFFQIILYGSFSVLTMPHVLCRLRNVEFSLIKNMLKEHAQEHAKDGLYMEHLWQNADDPREAVFLFKADNLERARIAIEKRHADARAQDPSINLPIVTYLE
jgi:hypothetical protein